MRRVLAPYGIKQKDLHQHLLNIGLIKEKKCEKMINDFSFVNCINQNKEIEILEKKNYEVYNKYDYKHYDLDQYRKEDLEDKIFYSLDCLIDPYDNEQIYSEDLDNINDIDKNTSNDDEDDENNNDYYNDYVYRKINK